MTRRTFVAGLAAFVTMVLVTTIDGLTRPGYSSTRHWISHLSLGDRGWLGVLNLIVCGILFTLFGIALLQTSRTAWPGSRAAVWGSRLVALAGVGLVVAGAFRIDPGLDYPPGEPATRTSMGGVHDTAAGVLFLSLIIAAVLLGRAAGRRGLGIAVAATVAVVFVACSVLAGLDHAGTWPSAPSGLLERIALFIAMAWPVAVAWRANENRSDAHPQALASPVKR